MFLRFRLIYLALIGLAVLWPSVLAADECKDILKYGVHDSYNGQNTEKYTQMSVHNVCKVIGRLKGKSRQAAISLMVRLFGVGGSIGDKNISSWLDENCTKKLSDGSGVRSATVTIRVANKMIIDAWVKCMSFRWSNEEKTGKIGWGFSDGQPVKDGKGGSAVFKIIVLGTKYNWRIKTHDEVVYLNNGDKTHVNMPDRLRNPYWLGYLNNAKEVFTIGTASCGIQTTVTEEINRAARRAEQLLKWMRGVASDTPSIAHIYGDKLKGYINLGKFEPPSGICREGDIVAGYQRPIGILLVLQKNIGSGSDGFSYKDALRYAASKNPAFPDISNYTSFQIVR